MRFGRADRVPLFGEGLRDDVLTRWRAEGLSPDAGFAARFDLDRREDIPVDWAPRPSLAHPLLTSRGLEELARGLDPEGADRLPFDWAKRCAAWRTRDHVLGLTVHDGLLLSMGVGDWAGFDEVMDILAVDPVFAAELMRIRGGFLAGYAARILRDVVPDYAVLSEPIAGNNGPVISPRLYRDLVLASYRPLLEVLRRGGVETIVYMTYANTRILLRDVLDAGFNTLWACEVNMEAMDYASLRRELGPRLRLIGGLDLDCLLESDEAVRREVETKVPVLLAQGGYCPLADGRVRANVPFPRYAFYRATLGRVVGQGTP
jgi:uroporphyrinogen decarboxylase